MKKLLIIFLSFLFVGCATLQSMPEEYDQRDVLGYVDATTLGFSSTELQPENKTTEKLISKLEKKALKKFGTNIKFVDVKITVADSNCALWIGGPLFGLATAGVTVLSSPDSSALYPVAAVSMISGYSAWLFKIFKASAKVVSSDTPYELGSIEVYTLDEIDQKQKEERIKKNQKIAAERKAEEERLEAERKAEKEKLEAEKKALLEKLEAERKAEEERLEAERKAEQEKLAAERKAEEERLEAEIRLLEKNIADAENEIKALIAKTEEETLKLEQTLIERAINCNAPLVFTNMGITEINSDNEVSLFVDYINVTDKVIKYIYLDLIPYNRVFDELYYKRKTIEVVDFVLPQIKNHKTWNRVWKDSTLLYFKIAKITVKYSDNSMDVIDDPNVINNLLFTPEEQKNYDVFNIVLLENQLYLKDY